MGNGMREHVENLGRHGVVVHVLGGTERLSGAFYDRVIRFCEQYSINCLGYEIDVPEADEPMMLAIWRNGHVDSGSAESIREIMDQ